MDRPKRKRISLDIPEELHKAIKEYVEDSGMTMTKFIIRMMIEKLEEINQFN
jgi:predicted DNA binding CopG/RHH family protein